MDTLIANSGIQFVVKEVELNFSEPFIFPDGKTLKYPFLQITDPITGQIMFDMAYFHPGAQVYIPLSELEDADALQKTPNGREKLDQSGIPIMSAAESPSLHSSYPLGSPELINITSLENYRVMNEATREKEPAYLRLLGKWLPMPMFEKEIDGITADVPYGWCRVRIDEIAGGGNGPMKRYRLIWAFDTKLGTDIFSTMRPMFTEADSSEKEYCLCNKPKQLISFLSTSNEFCAFSDYLKSESLFNVQPNDNSPKYIAYYIYFINFLRLNGAAPEIKVFNSEDPKKCIDVDLVLDIGNSRTCGILMEKGSYAARERLTLRNLSNPSIVYGNSFDMRLVFRMADFGNDINVDEEIFKWPSFVRVGEEAKQLSYKSIESSGVGRKVTNYSSPKRYLWDTKPYDGKWEFLTTEDDASNLKATENIYITGLSEMFDSKGNYYFVNQQMPYEDIDVHEQFSRSSLMTFVMIEIFMQATCQINTHAYRAGRGDIDCKRVLRNVVVTCPTAMPLREQIRLRQCAVEAADAVSRCMAMPNHCNVVPSPDSLKAADGDDGGQHREWSYDEASCCQLVYLYAEIAERYHGEIHRFIDLKGHVRPEDMVDGKGPHTLTIGSIDIGAGTTDVMINNYSYAGKGDSLITPTPVFWDSYYMAGDDIMRQIITEEILEGNGDGCPTHGSIRNALKARLLAMSNDELAMHPVLHVDDTTIADSYKDLVRNIQRAVNADDREQMVLKMASNMMHDFFGEHSRQMGYRHQEHRVDFNSQVCMHIAQKWLDLLTKTSNPAREYTYDELFEGSEPAKHLLDAFEKHFGFSFKELTWFYDPQVVGKDIKTAIEPLMRILAEVIHKHNCDILILAGRPTSLPPLTELFYKNLPVWPNRLILLNEYRIGEWYPFSEGIGNFIDTKSIVAVGGIIGYQASRNKTGFSGGANQPSMMLDFRSMIKSMKSTACFIGKFKTGYQRLESVDLSPTRSTARITVTSFPAYLGCAQFDTPSYQARPLYAIHRGDGVYASQLNITLGRNYHDNREEITVEDVTDMEGIELGADAVTLMQQSIVEAGGDEYWLDNGIFDLKLSDK